MATRLQWLLLAAVLCVASTCVYGAAEFDLNATDDEDTAVTQLQAAVSDGFTLDKTQGRALIASAMQRGWWGLAEVLVDVGRDAGVDLSSTVYQGAAVIRRKLQALTEAMGKSAVSSGIAPAFEWAQSPDSVFLNVKFAHKLGFEVHCKTKRKKFALNLDFHGSISPENSTWSMGAVGRATFTLRKAKRSTWPRLLASKQKPGNMHVWWTMHDKYESDNDKLEDEQRAEVRRQRKEDKAKADAAAAADPTPPPEATPEVEATPEPTPHPAQVEFDTHRAALDKEASKKRRDVEAKHKEAIAAIDTDARQRKKAIDDKASDDKKRVDDEASKKRESAEAELGSAKDALKAEADAAVAALRAELGLDTTNNAAEL